jgi:hypothetical protein
VSVSYLLPNASGFVILHPLPYLPARVFLLILLFRILEKWQKRDNKMPDYTLKELQQHIDNWISEVFNECLSLHKIMALLVEEVEETTRLVNHL